MNNIALDGVTVLDLSRVLAGPFCGMILGDMGARVIKVEAIGGGDDSRLYGPYINNESSYFMALNRNKDGITLNLKSDEGKNILKEFIRKADIVIENFRPGVMDRLGFGYEDAKKLNPRLVYASISGFGNTGPYKERAGYDIISQAMGGLMALTGVPDGEPMKANCFIGDVLGGLNAAIGILAAYSKSLKTGIGQRIDVSLVDSIVAALSVKNHIYLSTGELPKRLGNGEDFSFPYGAFKAKDGFIVIGCSNDNLFVKFAETMGKPELSSDERFCKNSARLDNMQALTDIIEEWLSDKTPDEAVKIITGGTIPAAPIMSIDRISHDPHIAGARKMFQDLGHAIAPGFKVTASPIKMSDTPTDVRKPSPLLGEHTDRVLKEFFHYDDARLAELRAAKVI